MTRQPVTTISFSGSPGRRSLPGVRRRPDAATRRRNGWPALSRPPRAPPRTWRRARCPPLSLPSLPHRPRPRPQRATDRRGGLERQGVEHRLGDVDGRCCGLVPSGLQSRAEIVAPEVQADVVRGGRRNVERAEAVALFCLRRRPVDLEPPGRTATEAEGAAVISRADQDDLARATAEGACDLGIDELRALGYRCGPAEGGAERTGDAAVEAAFRLDVPARGRGARALQAESLRGEEARRQRGMPGACHRRGR